MATVTVTNHAVFPTGLDVNGGTPGSGTVWTEQTTQSLFKALAQQQSYIISGFDPPSTGGGTLTKAITGGEAVISGYRVKGTASNNITFGASATEHLYLQLVFSGTQVSGLELFTNTTGTRPSNSVKIAQVVTNGSNPTTVTDQRPSGRVIYGRANTAGTITDVGSSDWTVTTLGAGQCKIVPNTSFLRAPIGIASKVGTGNAGIEVDPISGAEIRFQHGSTHTDFCFWIFG